MTKLNHLWEWAESTPPAQVTKEQQFRLFGLLSLPEGCNSESGKCRKTVACKCSPYCLGGGITPASLYKTLKDSKKEMDKFKEIEEQQRAEDEYVGLDNLGATCYVNSYLQMWFHTAPFRNLILGYEPVAGASTEPGYDESIESTIHQMRLLFAQMLLTKKRSLMPDAFIETLGLDPNNQQDAQEFSNLWMGILQHRFGTAFSRLFVGSCDVSTTCNACKKPSRKPDEFSELILNVPAADATPQVHHVDSPGRRPQSLVNLEDVMRRYFGDEVLEGDNAYMCNFSECHVKGKAVRRTRLERAPPILHAQVLRFAFDPVKMTRKKLRTCISFPETFELRREYFADDSPELRNSSLPRYRIKAILCHIGTSVVRGHYTARIRLRDGWYIFNDAQVKKGDPTSGGDGGVDADESGGSGGRRFRSADAYCIVYHRMDASELNFDDDLKTCAQCIPPNLREEVDEGEAKFCSEIESKISNITADIDAKEQSREKRLRIRRDMLLTYSPLTEKRDLSVGEAETLFSAQAGGGVVFAHKDFLTDYFLLKEQFPPFTRALGLGESARCDHGRLGLDYLGNLRLITRRSADEVLTDLNYQHDSEKESRDIVIFSPSDLCMTCLRMEAFELYYDAQMKELESLIKVELKDITNNENAEKRKYWIKRENLDNFAGLCKTALENTIRCVRQDLKNAANDANDSLGNDIDLPQPPDNGEVDQSVIVDNFFGLSSNSDFKTKSLKRSDPSCLAQSEEKSPSSSSRPSKRAKMTRGAGTYHPIAEQLSPVQAKNVDVEIKIDTDEEQLQQAIKASLRDLNGDANSSIESKGKSRSLQNRIFPEISQDIIVQKLKFPFHFNDLDLNASAQCDHEALWYSIPQTNSARKSRGAVDTFGMVRISEDLWLSIFQFFPASTVFVYPDMGPCGICGKTALEQRSIIESNRAHSKLMSSQLGDLAKRIKRPCITRAVKSVNLVTAMFCQRLNDHFNSGFTTQWEKKVFNCAGLCVHKRLAYTADELAYEASSDRGDWVVVKQTEWKIIKENFTVDIEVVLKPVTEKNERSSSAGPGAPLNNDNTTWKKFLVGGNDNRMVGNRHFSARCNIDQLADESESVEATRSIEISSESGTNPTEGEEEVNALTDEEDFVEVTGKKGKAAVRGKGNLKGRNSLNKSAANAIEKKKFRVGWDCLPGTCVNCHNERVRELAISASIPKPLEWSGRVYVRAEASGALGEDEPLPPLPTIASTRTRRNPRRTDPMKRKQAAMAGEAVEYVVDSNVSFVDFQLSVLEDFEISPLEQIFMLHDPKTGETQPLENPKEGATLGEMMVPNGQIFYLHKKEDDEDAHGVAEGDENNKGKSKANNRPEGFGGTLLSALANAAPVKRGAISPSSRSSAGAANSSANNHN